MKKFNEDLSESEKNIIGIVEFDSPELIITTNSAANPFPLAKLRNPITTAAILWFLELNKQYLTQAEGESISFDKDGKNVENPFVMDKLEELDAQFEADIVEFDDKFSDKGLCKHWDGCDAFYIKSAVDG